MNPIKRGIFIFCIFFCIIFSLNSQTTWIGITNDWNEPTNWSAGVPHAGIDAVIANVGLAPQLTAPGTSANLNINTGATLSTGIYNLTVNGSINNNGGLTGGAGLISVTGDVTGSGTLTGGSGNIDVDGAVSINNFIASADTTNIGGDFSSSLFTHNGGTIVLDTIAASNISATGAFYNLQINFAKQLGADCTVNNQLILNNAVLSLNTWNLNINSDIDLNGAAGGLHLNAAGSSLDMNNHSITISAGTLDHDFGDISNVNTFTVNSSGLYSGTDGGTGTVGCSGLLSLGGTATFILGNKDFTVNGFNQSGGTFNGDTGSVCSSANVEVTGGSHVMGTYSLEMTGNGTSLNFTGGRNPYDLNINCGNANMISLISDLTVGHDLNLLDGDLNLGGFALTVRNNLNANANDRLVCTAALETIRIQGDVDFSATGSNFMEVNSQFIIDGNDTSLTAPEETFDNLVLEKAGSTNTLTLNSNILVSGSLTLTTGRFLLNGQSFSLFSNFDLNSSEAALLLDVAGSILDMNNNSISISTGTLDHDYGNINNVTIFMVDGTGVYNGTPGGAGSVNCSSLLTLNAMGTVSLGNKNFSVNGFTQSGGTFNGNLGSISSSANVSVTAGTHNSGNYILEMTGNGTSILFTGARNPYNLNINCGAGNRVSLAAALLIEHDLILTSGELDVTTSNFDLTVTQGWNNAGGIFNERSGTVYFAGNGDTNTESFYNLQISSGTRTSSGNWTVTNGISLNGGAFNPGNNVHQITGNWDDRALNFQAGTGTIRLNSINPNIFQDSSNNFFNLTIVDAVTLGTAIDINGSINIMAGNFTSNSFDINIGGDWINNGVFFPANGNVIFDGTGSIRTDETFYNLIKEGNLTTTSFEADLIITNSLTIQNNGTLAEDGVGTRTITMNGIEWTNSTGNFTAGDGEVIFQNPGITEIRGDTTFYNFTCIVPNAILKIESGSTITVADSGVFRIQGSAGNLINLTRIAGPGNWSINILAGAFAILDFVNVSYSTGVQPLYPASTCIDAGGPNINWRFALSILNYLTFDGDPDGSGPLPADSPNGRIDSIEVEVEANINDNFNYVSGDLVVEVEGYTVLGIDTGATGNDKFFTIRLQEIQYPDTDATPRFRILQNDDPAGVPEPLRAQSGGAIVSYGSTWYTPMDRAVPSIGYTLTVANHSPARGYIYFSEPVANSGTISAINHNNFVETLSSTITSVTIINPAGVFCHEAYLNFSGVVTTTEILDFQTIRANSGVNNIVDTSGNVMRPFDHRISDYGLNILHMAYALDLEVSRDATRGGMGYTSDFSQRGWIRDVDMKIAVSLGELSSVDPVRMYYDSNVSASVEFDNIWIPNITSNDTVRIRPNTSASFVDPVVSGNQREYTILNSDNKIYNEANLDMLLIIRNGAANEFPCLNVPDLNDPKTSQPWKLLIKDIITQKSKVSILKNVFNPLNDEKVNLYYELARSGTVLIMVFDLKGDIVDILFRGKKEPGEHTTAWDGKDRGGRLCARGVYLIKITGPDLDEFRKVLIVK